MPMAVAAASSPRARLRAAALVSSSQMCRSWTKPPRRLWIACLLMSTGARERDALGGGGARRRGRTRGGRGDASPGDPPAAAASRFAARHMVLDMPRARGTRPRIGGESTIDRRPSARVRPDPERARPRARSRPRRLDLGARLDELARRRVERAAPNDRRRGYREARPGSLTAPLTYVPERAIFPGWRFVTTANQAGQSHTTPTGCRGFPPANRRRGFF